MAFPVDPQDIEVGLYLDGSWVDAVAVGNGVRMDPEIQISRGRQNWASQVDPSRAAFNLDSRDGRWSPDNPSGAYYGNYRRNIPCRIGIGRDGVHLRTTGASADVASTPDIAGTGGGSPTAPAYASVTQSTETAFTTTHGVDLPATINSTDRLLLVVAAGHQSLTPKDQGSGVTDLDDWTLVLSDNLYTPWHAWRVYEIEVVDSTQATALAGSTVEFSTTQAVKSSAQVIRTTGARSGGQGSAWDVSTVTSSAFNSAPNPPSLTASYGADEQRWYAFAVYGSGTDTVSTYPASYTSIADTGATPQILIASAHRTTSGATEDPGAYALTGDENNQAFTFVYRATEDTSSDGVLDISGDIDVRVSFQLEEDLIDIDDGGIRARLAVKTSGANGWGFQVYSALGDVVASFTWVDSSGNLKAITTQQSGGTLPRSFLHDEVALRFTLDVDNGASGHDGTWYTSDAIDGTWTQLGSTATVSGTTSIKTNDAALRVGGRPEDSATARIPVPGKVIAFELRDGIAGTVVANPDFSAQTINDTSFVDSAGRTWTIGSGGRISNINWRFHGELSSLPLRYNKRGNDLWAPVEAQGLFRRLRQGNRRLDSALNRAIVRDASDLVQYWPMEETGDTVSAFGASVGTAAFNITGGYPTAATNTDFLSSSSLPTPGDTIWTAVVDSYTQTDAWQIRWLQSIPATFTGTDIEIISIQTTDMEWRIRYRDTSGGQLEPRAFRGATNVYQPGYISFNATGKAFRMSLTIRQNGSNVDVLLEAQEEDEPAGGGYFDASAVAGTAGRVTQIRFNPSSAIDDWAIGHVTLQSADTPTTELTNALQSYTGETAGRRIERICREEGIATRIEGDPDETEQMGAQRPGTLMGLLQECADTDLGILYESRTNVAVAYRCRTSMLDQTAAIALDASNEEVAEPLELDRDDQNFANDITVENWNGTTGRAVLNDGSALSVSEPPIGAGRYDSTFPLNGLNSRLVALASSRLALTSVDEPRVSRLVLELHGAALSADAALTANILHLSLGDRITVANNPTAALGASNSVSQLIQGYNETIGPWTHRMELNTTPESPWTSGTVTPAPDTHSVSFRSQQTLATSGAPEHVLTALGYTDTAAITRADLDDILDDWVSSTGGTTRNVTSSATMTSALAAALPGDLIRVTTGFDAPVNARGDRYGISGATLTTSTDGGLPGLPIIITCADGVYIDDNDTASNDGVLDLQNCVHVWAVGVNVRDGQFGIRAWNWGGEAGYPAYIAYCNIENTGHAGLQVAGWFQAITSSGGTPPSGTGNEWGFSQYCVIESNTIDGVGVIADNFGEGIYLGYGGSPGWKAYVKDAWIRGNVATDWTSDGIDVKPGCHRIYITDNEIHTGHAVSGSPCSLLYVATSIDDRPAEFDFDPEIWFEGNRVYDNNITNTNGSSANIMGYVGLSGCRIANNVMWANPQTGTHCTWRFRNEKATNDTEALAEFRADPTWIINNTCWNDDAWENAGYGSGGGFPVVFPSSVTTSWEIRNNIVDQASPATGEVDAASSDFIATVPAIGAAGDAEWLTYGNGSAFDLDPDSALVAAGEDISDITFFIEQDISQRDLNKTTPNPGAFQQHPANQ